MKNSIKLYEEACEALAKDFIKIYFPKEDDSYWICDEIGGVFCVNSDFYFNVEGIWEALKLKPTFSQLFNYYDYCYECRKDNIDAPVNNLKFWMKEHPAPDVEKS